MTALARRLVTLCVVIVAGGFVLAVAGGLVGGLALTMWVLWTNHQAAAAWTLWVPATFPAKDATKWTARTSYATRDACQAGLDRYLAKDLDYAAASAAVQIEIGDIWCRPRGEPRPGSTYTITAPDGHTYKVTGPAGATEEQVRAEILHQNPQAGRPDR